MHSRSTPDTLRHPQRPSVFLMRVPRLYQIDPPNDTAIEIATKILPNPHALTPLISPDPPLQDIQAGKHAKQWENVIAVEEFHTLISNGT
jgi:hypothetical protein